MPVYMHQKGVYEVHQSHPICVLPHRCAMAKQATYTPVDILYLVGRKRAKAED